MHPMKTRRVARTSVVLLLLVLPLLLAGCVARGIREAQDAFNRAAAAEQQIDAAPEVTTDGMRGSSAAASGYALASSLLDSELAHHESDLAEEKLLGTALVLKALCLWRLDGLAYDGDVAAAPDSEAAKEDARRTAEFLAAVEKAKATDDLGTRDRVLLEALPGLRDHDRALRAKDYETAKRFFVSAFETLERALQTVDPPKNHPVRVYVGLAQLRTLRAWQAANYAMNKDAEAQGETEKIHESAECVLARLATHVRTTPGLREQIDALKLALGMS